MFGKEPLVEFFLVFRDTSPKPPSYMRQSSLPLANPNVTNSIITPDAKPSSVLGKKNHNSATPPKYNQQSNSEVEIVTKSKSSSLPKPGKRIQIREQSPIVSFKENIAIVHESSAKGE